jgi:lipoate-protein ligase A
LPLHYLEETLSGAADNLALDEHLLLVAEADDGPEVLRVWEWPASAVVLGAGCRLAEDVDEVACRAEGVPILRRSSGGGTVLLGAGCLLYSLVLRYERDPMLNEIRSSYHHILGRVVLALGGEAAGIAPAGISDLAREGRKVSGTAQQRKRRHLLHHGTLLYAFDLDGVPRFLRHPPREPDYRAGRPHQAFLDNLPLSVDAIKRGLRQVWGADAEGVSWSTEQVRGLVEEKYASAEWIRRR